jgi:hypothetical protein
MVNRRRFEVALPAVRRAELARLADDAGISSADLVRLAIVRLLANPDVITGRKSQEAA